MKKWLIIWTIEYAIFNILADFCFLFLLSEFDMATKSAIFAFSTFTAIILFFHLAAKINIIRVGFRNLKRSCAEQSE